MRTQKNISNIAYHRPEIFAERVRELRSSGVIGPCMWIFHNGEGGDKDHIHFLLLGGYQVYNTLGLESLFGFDIFPDGRKESMTALWRTTKEVFDWILYDIHEPQYLALKNEQREFQYSFDDIMCCEEDRDILRNCILEAKAKLDALGDRVVVAVKRMYFAGKSLAEVLTSGIVPIGCMKNVERLWEALGAMKPDAFFEHHSQ